MDRNTTTPATTLAAVLALAGALFAVPAGAHHSQAPYFDQERDVRIEGVVQRFDFRNPHPVLYVEVPDEHGNPQVWSLQFASIAILARVGIKADTFAPGERIVAVGHPARNPNALGMASVAVTKEDGTELVDPLRSGSFAQKGR